MGSKYQPLGADEKFHDVVFPTRTSTSESLGSTLLEDEEDSRITEPRSRFNINWMWLVHAVLLTLSFGLFISAYFTRASTLTHVQHFSAYCESRLFLLRLYLLTTAIAPAAKAVEYQTIKFNDTMGEHSPYVGKGPEVDKAWHAISYDSELFPIATSHSGSHAEVLQLEIKWSRQRN